MEDIRFEDIYNILYGVLDRICDQIMNNRQEEEETEELTVDNILDVIEEELEAGLYEEEQGYDDFDGEEAIREREENQVTELLTFLTGDDEKYIEALKAVFEEMEYPFIQDFILYKYILILMVTSIGYCGLVYDETKGLIDSDDEMLDIYESLIYDPQSIYRLFQDKQNENIARKIIDTFFNYFCLEDYIKTSLMLSTVKEQGKLPKLLKMNPLECFSYMHTFAAEDITEGEKAIQNFMDAYDYTINHDYDEESTAEERKDMFLEALERYYQHDNLAIDKAISYVFGNIYESLKTTEKDYYDGQNLVQVIEDNAKTLNLFIEAFKEDTDFFWLIVDTFHSFNYGLDPDTLALRRWQFKTTDGNVKLLKKLNPYYSEEEESFDDSSFSIK